MKASIGQKAINGQGATISQGATIGRSKFVGRQEELRYLEEQYKDEHATMVVIYGRRRMGKTTLIREFSQGKPFIYFLATEEAERFNIRAFKNQIAEFADDALLAQARVDNWDILFQTLAKRISGRKLVLALDEFQCLGKANAAFPSIMQRVWDAYLQNANIMLILCGSLVNMMEAQALNYASPLYGRRTGQIKLRQIDFPHYAGFFDRLSYKDLVERYAVTGGVPKYIELFDRRAELFSEIERLVLNKRSLLFEEPVFLLQNEVAEVGSYFSIIKSIAAGNRRMGKICADLEAKKTNLPKYLKTLSDLDILAREVPVTESNPEKSKMGLYRITDNYLSFWFRFVYPEKARLELCDTSAAMGKIRDHFVGSHVAFVYESVCQSEMWQMARYGILNFDKLGRWWNNNEEIGIVGIDSGGDEIVFGECKYQGKEMDIDVFAALARKKENVPWNIGRRKEKFALFSISGFTGRLHSLAEERGDIILFQGL